MADDNLLTNDELDNLVWHTMLDQRYDVRVVRTDESHGDLIISENETVLFTKPVTLAYGAIFGPDVADVADWEDMAVEFVDGRNTDANAKN